MPALRRVAPALLLLLLAPIVAEFLLGDFSVRKLGLVLALLPLYGGGALLIREIARRAGRGWPTMIFLAIAYAVLEEAFLTQSIFNPNYVGQRLLDYGYIAWLGTSLNWTLFVLTIHVVWSVATPILIAEGLAGDRRTAVWLKKPGTMLTAVLFLFGCVSTVAFSLKMSPFVATATQFATAGTVVVLAVIAAPVADGRYRGRAATMAQLPAAPRPIVAFFVCLGLAGGFMIAEDRSQSRMLPAASLVIRLVLIGAAAWLLARWGRAREWGARHYLAIASATTFTYTLVGLSAFLHGHTNLGEPAGTVDLAGQVALASLVFVAIWIGARHSERSDTIGSTLDARRAGR